MSFSLGPAARASGYRLVAHDAIDSTSTEAIRLALEGAPGRLWIVAGEQTDGHGRRGSSWQMPQGNLAASLLMPVAGDGYATATLGFAAGLALNGAIRAVAPALEPGGGGERLQLKWPNDVLIDGAKVAGILLEAVSPPSGPDGVVIGIGVNVCQAPRDLLYPATSLAQSGVDVTAEALFQALAETWVEQESLWNAGHGFAAIRDRWLTHAAGLGAPIAVRLGAEIVRGTFETIDEAGRLVVRAADGAVRAISAGEVYFGAAASVVF
jgi:BirA family biotin operon repressor/biotin-[acetyl-CoA-carboxylase] ligase